MATIQSLLSWCFWVWKGGYRAFVSLPIDLPRIRDIATPAHAQWQPGARVRRGRDGPATEDPAEFFLLLQCGLERPHTLDRCLRSISVARTVDVAVSQKFSTEPHPAIPRAPPPTSSPVLSEGVFLKLTLLRRASEDASAAPAPGRLDRDDWAVENRTPSVTKNSPSCIPTFGGSSRGSLNSVSACGSWRANRPCYVWPRHGRALLRIECYTLISRRDRDDGRLGGGVAVFALEKLGSSGHPPWEFPGCGAQLGDYTLWPIADQSTTAAAKWITDTILCSASSCIPLSTLRTKKILSPVVEWPDRRPRRRQADSIGETLWEGSDACMQCRSRSSLSRLHHPYCAENALYQALFQVVVEKGQGSYETRGQVSRFLAFKSYDGEWVLDAQRKANLFAGTFAEKCKLPRLCYNSFTVCTQWHELQTSVVSPSVEQRMALLTGLRDDCSTGPGFLPARILKRCAEQLAKPVQSLLQRMLETKSWPESWREHWVVPIHKKKAVFAASIYRGVHLAAQLSKVAERPTASIDWASHQPHSCFWTKPVCVHQMSRSTRCTGLPNDVMFGSVRQSSSWAFTGETPMLRSTTYDGRADGILATATHGTCGGWGPVLR